MHCNALALLTYKLMQSDHVDDYCIHKFDIHCLSNTARTNNNHKKHKNPKMTLYIDHQIPLTTDTL